MSTATITEYAERFVIAAPRELRVESSQLSGAEYVDRYCSAIGPVRLGDWSVAKRNLGSAEYSSGGAICPTWIRATGCAASRPSGWR